MKFFTVEAYNDCDEDGINRTFPQRDEAYNSGLEEIADVLPGHLMELARLPGVDDGLVVEVHHVHSQQRLLLILRCGFIEMGYYDLLLTYEEAEITPEHEWLLARIARTNADIYDVCAHELDLEEDGRIAHRILFHPGVWFGIRCRELHWDTVNRLDQSLPPLSDRFPGGPTAPPQRLRRRRLRREISQA